MENELVWAGFALGFLGSAHCAGMCGPIVLALPGSDQPTASLITGRLLYNVGRVITYMVLGIVVGLIGAGASLAGYQQLISIITGVMILAFALLPKKFYNKLLHQSPAFFNNTFGSLFKKLMKNGSPASLFGIGLLNGLLPCGFVYMGLIGALAMGSLWNSVAFMGLFGLGTIPLLFAMSLITRFMGADFRFKLQRLLPVGAAILGILLILRGLSLGIPFISPDLSNGMMTGAESCH